MTPQTQEKMACFLEKARNNGFALRVTSGYRTPQEQQTLYNKGRTTPGPIVTNARGLPVCQSNHCKGIAFDIVDRNTGYNINWNKLVPLAKSCGLSWGGDWTGFVDKPHFENNGAPATPGHSGGDEMTTASDLDRIYLAFYDTIPDEQAKKDYIGKPLDQTLQTIFDGPGYKEYEAKRREAVSQYPKLKEKVKDLEGKLVLTSQELKDTQEAGQTYIEETNKQIQLLEDRIKELEVSKPDELKPAVSALKALWEKIVGLWRS